MPYVGLELRTPEIKSPVLCAPGQPGAPQMAILNFIFSAELPPL